MRVWHVNQGARESCSEVVGERKRQGQIGKDTKRKRKNLNP